MSGGEILNNEKEQTGFSIHFNLLPFKAGFLRLWAEISVIALILSLFAGRFYETAGTVILVWVGIGAGKFLLALFPPGKRKEKELPFSRQPKKPEVM